MQRLLILFETLFLATIWWQTRIDLSQWWSNLRAVPVVSDYLIPHLYLSEVLLWATLAVWAGLHYQEWLRGRKTWRPSREIARQWWVWLMGLVAVTAVGLLVNEVGWWGWYAWLRLIEGGLLIALAADRLRTRPVAERYGLVLGAGLVFTSAMLIGEWIFQRSLGFQWLGEWHFSVMTPGVAKITVAGAEYLRPYATFAHPNVAAGILAVALPWMALATWPRILQRWPVWWRWLAVGVSGLGLLLTFSRSAWIVAVGFLAWAAWPTARSVLAHRSWWNKERQLALAAIIGGSVVLIGLMGPVLAERFISLTTTDTASLDRRVQLNEVAVELWQQQPVWGIGLRQFVPAVAEYGPLFGVGIWRQPVHNFFLLVLSEVGIVGLFMAVGLFVAVLSPLLLNWWRGQNRSLPARLLVGSWISWLLLGLIDHYWWTIPSAWLGMCLLLGATLAFHRSQKPETRSQHLETSI